MPKKYHIDVQPAPPRYPTIGKSGIVDWGEGCLKCARCVKYDCVYGVYDERRFSADIHGDTIDNLCKSCFRCVQGCPKKLIHKTLNPEWELLGDSVYLPEIISITWAQAENGKIPVSGAGYGGAFSGPGFDSMWTDMSEIVRPTRDGIHGREYISTVVDLGRRPDRLEFDASGTLLSEPKPNVRVPLPILFTAPPFGDMSPAVWRAIAKAAASLQTLAILPKSEALALTDLSHALAPLLTPGDDLESLESFRVVELHDSPDALARMQTLKTQFPGRLVSIRMPAISKAENVARVIEYARSGVEMIHYVADETGAEPDTENGLHLKDVIREVNRSLLAAGLRDQVTVMASGGIAMAEHVVKAMLCGLNLVCVDIPLLIALECRVCRNCREGAECPVTISGIDGGWGAKRIVNLIGAWHNQILEMMGAMGIREARRLRGEQGRVMFVEDLENDSFAQIFASRG